MTFEELRAAGLVPVRECSICGVPIGYRTHSTHVAAFFDPTCDCSGGGNERLLSYDELMRIPPPAGSAAAPAPIQSNADEREAMVVTIKTVRNECQARHGFEATPTAAQYADALLAAGWTRKREAHR